MADIKERFPNDIILHSFISFEELKNFSAVERREYLRDICRNPLLLCIDLSLCGLENADLDSIYEGLILREHESTGSSALRTLYLLNIASDKIDHEGIDNFW